MGVSGNGQAAPDPGSTEWFLRICFFGYLVLRLDGASGFWMVSAPDRFTAFGVPLLQQGLTQAFALRIYQLTFPPSVSGNQSD